VSSFILLVALQAQAQAKVKPLVMRPLAHLST